MAERPRITILLCSYNGGRYLRAQLESFAAQDHAGWDLWVSDDGSRDDTRAVLADFRAGYGDGRQIRLVDGPQRGVAANFLSLLCHPDLPPGPVALSDQDDVWLPGKLSLSLDALAGAGHPVALLGAQSLHVGDDLQPVGRTRPAPRGPSFQNALTQNIISGHSATLSPGALALVRQAGPVMVPWHDWWLYQLIAGAGGKVILDPRDVVLYRQHGHATMGAHQGLRASIARIRQLFGREYGAWARANLAALAARPDLLTPENRALVAALRAARRGPGRARAMAQGGLHRQSTATTAALYLATALGRV